MVQPDSQALTTSLQQALSPHLEPDIKWTNLPMLLDIIAHVSLLATKLRSEIVRIRDLVEKEMEMEHQLSLTGICTMCKTAEERLWKQSLQLRELSLVAALSSTVTDLNRFPRLIETYWPDLTGKDVPTRPRLYIRALPVEWNQAFAESKKRAEGMYAREKQGRERPDEYNTTHIVRDLDAESVVAETVLNTTKQVFEYIAFAEKILANYTGKTSRVPRRSSVHVKIEDMPSKIPARAARNVEQDERPSSSSSRQRSEPSTSTRRDHDRNDRTEKESTNTRSQSTSTPAPMRGKIEPVTRKKKRGRPSFPPREGPDYTRPLPTASVNVKKHRLHPFQSRDLR